MHGIGTTQGLRWPSAQCGELKNDLIGQGDFDFPARLHDFAHIGNDGNRLADAITSIQRYGSESKHFWCAGINDQFIAGIVERLVACSIHNFGANRVTAFDQISQLQCPTV